MIDRFFSVINQVVSVTVKNLKNGLKLRPIHTAGVIEVGKGGFLKHMIEWYTMPFTK